MLSAGNVGVSRVSWAVAVISVSRDTGTMDLSAAGVRTSH